MITLLYRFCFDLHDNKRHFMLLTASSMLAPASEYEGLFTSSQHDKANDIKLLYGAMFADRLNSVKRQYTHWGWVDLSCIYGDLSPMVAKLSDFDVVTYPDVVCHLVEFTFFIAMASLLRHVPHVSLSTVVNRITRRCICQAC